MSKYVTRHVHEKTRFGFIDEVRQNIWSLARYDVFEAITKGLLFQGPVPQEVAEQLLDWRPRESAARYDAPRDQVDLAIDLTHAALKDLEFQALAEGWTEDRAQAARSALYRSLVDLAAPVSAAHKAVIGEHGLPLDYPSCTYALHDHKAVLLRSAEALLGAGAAIASVGCLGGGEFMFMSYRVDKSIFTPLGEVYPYVSTGTSHARKLASHISCGTILRQCDNTTMADFGFAEARGRAYKVRHTSGSKFDTKAAADTLGLAVARTEAWAAGMERLANVGLSADQRQKLVEFAIPVPEEEGRSRTMALNKRAEFIKILDRDPRVPADQRMTLAGLWQAHNTFAQWGESLRGNSDPMSRMSKEVITSGAVASDAAFWELVGRFDEFKALVPA